MPIYDYECARCGGFSAWGAMRTSDAPATCPGCGARAARVISAPYLNDMKSATRIAHQRNERSAHEPRVLGRSELEATGLPRNPEHRHGAGHRAERLERGLTRAHGRWSVGH